MFLLVKPFENSLTGKKNHLQTIEFLDVFNLKKTAIFPIFRHATNRCGVWEHIGQRERDSFRRAPKHLGVKLLTC